MLFRSPDLDELKRRCDEVKDFYDDLNVKLVRPAGDMLGLHSEFLPASKRYINDYVQYVKSDFLAGLGFAAVLLSPESVLPESELPPLLPQAARENAMIDAMKIAATFFFILSSSLFYLFVLFLCFVLSLGRDSFDDLIISAFLPPKKEQFCDEFALFCGFFLHFV